jgi:short-subunit dehydrogenase
MQNDKYVLITGAGEGLGKSLAFEFARRGWNLILVALPGPQLCSLACFIRRNYLADVITYETDLCEEQNCIELYEKIHMKGIRIQILINNAGIGNTFQFSEGSIGFFGQQIKLNVLATTLITKLFLKDLCDGGPSYIVNIGSLSSFFFLPCKQVYGGTKSFIYSFSKSLRSELSGKGVSVSVVCPAASIQILIKLI